MTAKLILASASPRRADLLRLAGVEFECRPAAIDETRLFGMNPYDHALRLATEKALTPAEEGRLSLGADTIVVLGECIFEKPQDDNEAVRHLETLSGRTHQVVTAFCLARGSEVLEQGRVVAEVTFRKLTAGTIARYVATGEGRDKAGAYGLQGWGGFLVEEIRGSHTCVVGLPLTEVLNVLQKYSK